MSQSAEVNRENLTPQATNVDLPKSQAATLKLKRDQILDKALPLFLERGFSATSMSMIAASVGGSKATLYSYFTTKPDLFIALMRRTWDLQGRAPDFGTSACYAVDAETWLRQRVFAYLSHLHGDDVIAIHRLIIGEAYRFPTLGRQLFEAGPATGLADLAADLTVLESRRLIYCRNVATGAQLLRSLMQSGSYERRLWSARLHPSLEELTQESETVSSMFLSVYGLQANAVDSPTGGEKHDAKPL